MGWGLAIFCCWRRSYKLWDGIPKLKYLKEMDRPTILRVLDFCAVCDPDKTAAACCGYLDPPEKDQKVAIVEALLLLLWHETVSHETYDSVLKTTTKLLQHPVSSFPDLQIVGCRVLVQVGFKLPDLVLWTIIEFFKLRTIPQMVSAWCLNQLIRQKEAAIKHSEGFILENVLPVMEKARSFSQRLHFSGAFEALASAFVQSTEAEHAPQYLQDYLICKAYLEAPCKNTEEMCRIRERVLLALSPITPLLPSDQLAVEIPILIREVLFLQGSLPKENSFSLIKPLEQFIQAGVSKACKETFSPEILTALHNVISAPGPLSKISQAAQGKAKELLLLLETHQTTLLNAGDQASGIEYPPFTTSEDTLGQRTSPNSETTDSEMEPSRPDMLEAIESLIPYDHGRQRVTVLIS
ncbi:hypothetical protein NDU88_005269 [Pleurodeles waltl]|uniref:MROH2B-like N-terminal HEAT-repeats domain-containing protein n=1 Tax=Pleurodeles waltl TaxID=8319 RepID=A0AAV7RMT8_PLEWA|nr:hypothetical protein NDU88_005269 [Pleurodeles waltl]